MFLLIISISSVALLLLVQLVRQAGVFLLSDSEIPVLVFQSGIGKSGSGFGIFQAFLLRNCVWHDCDFVCELGFYSVEHHPDCH